MKSDYFPVPLKKIVIDSYPDFDLFIKRQDRFVLYRKGGYKFKQENIDNLIENKIDSLYVAKEDVKRYEEYRKRMPDEAEEEAPEENGQVDFTNAHEIEQYHEIMDNFFVVNHNLLQKGEEVDFPVYYHAGNNVHLFSEFEKKPEAPWELADRISVSSKELLIRRQDIHKYQAFINRLMSAEKEAEDNHELKVMRKAVVLREMSKVVIQEILDDPRSGEKLKNLKDQVYETTDFVLENVDSFYSLMVIHSHDFYTYTHSLNVSTFCVGFGSALGLFKSPDLEWLALGGALHDVGKSRVDTKLINKPSKLTPEEFEEMKKHVLIGIDLLKEHHDLPKEVLEIVAQHHEKLTGTGYPNSLKGDQVSYFGRISAIVDVYDALTTERPYKKALTPFEALNIIARIQGEFDEKLVKKFIVMLGKQLAGA